MKTAKLIAITLAFCALTTIPFATTSVSGQQTETKTAETESATDWSKLNGTWKATSGTMGGQALPADGLDTIRLKIDNGSFDFAGTGIEQTGKLAITPATEEKPATLDVNVEEGPNEGSTVEAIYKIEEGKLIVCYAMSGDRPTEFASTSDSNTLLLVYEAVEE